MAFPWLVVISACCLLRGRVGKQGRFNQLEPSNSVSRELFELLALGFISGLKFGTGEKMFCRTARSIS